MAKNYPRQQYTQVKEPVAVSTEEIIQEELISTEELTQETVEETVIETVEVQEPEVVKETVSEATPATIQEGFTPVYKVELELSQYAEAMDKQKVVNPEEGGRWQYSLFNTIKSILNVPDQETFNKEWNTVLNYFNKNKDGIFNESFIFRFPQNWPGSPQEFTMHRRIVYTLIQTANPKTRNKAIAEINMSMVTEGMTEKQRNHLNAFYNV